MAYLQDAIVTSTTTLQAKLAAKRVIVLDGSVVPLSLEEERARPCSGFLRTSL